MILETFFFGIVVVDQIGKLCRMFLLFSDVFVNPSLDYLFPVLDICFGIVYRFGRLGLKSEFSSPRLTLSGLSKP